MGYHLVVSSMVSWDGPERRARFQTIWVWKWEQKPKHLLEHMENMTIIGSWGKLFQTHLIISEDSKLCFWSSVTWIPHALAPRDATTSSGYGEMWRCMIGYCSFATIQSRKYIVWKIRHIPMIDSSAACASVLRTVVHWSFHFLVWVITWPWYSPETWFQTTLFSQHT